jgi:hypothetical protein
MRRGETAGLIARQIAIDLDADGEDHAALVIDEAGLEIYKARRSRSAGSR